MIATRSWPATQGVFISPINLKSPSGAFHAGDIGNIPCTPGGYARLEISKAEVHPLGREDPRHYLADPFLETPLNAMLIAAKDLFPAEMGIGRVLHRV